MDIIHTDTHRTHEFCQRGERLFKCPPLITRKGEGEEEEKRISFDEEVVLKHF